MGKNSAMLSLHEETVQLSQKEEAVKKQEIRSYQETGQRPPRRQIMSTEYVSIDKNGNRTDNPLAVADVVTAEEFNRRQSGKRLL